MHRGWVRFWRKSRDSAVYTDELWRLWSHCLFRANHAPTKVLVDRKADPIDVAAGQFITGRNALHREMYPKFPKSAPSPSTLWRRLEILKKLGNLNIQTNSRYTLVTVCEYSTYNPANPEFEQPDEPQVNRRRTAGEPQVNTEKNVKNSKNAKEEEKTTSSCSEPPQAATSEPVVVLTYPTVGKGAQTWNLTQAKLAEYVESFPGVDVLMECRKALQWCRDKPKKRKTPQGMAGFLTGWLGRVQNQGGGRGNQTTSPGSTYSPGSSIGGI